MAAPVAGMGAGNAIADFSDNDEMPNQNEASEEEVETYNKPRGSLAARMAAASAKSIQDDSASENEEPKEYISKAAGFAARMRALESKPILDNSSSESEKEDPRMKGLSARERMKLMLQKEKEPAQPELSNQLSAPVITGSTAESSDDDEEDTPVARKSRNRPARTSSPPREASPEPTELAQPSEESLFFSPTKVSNSPADAVFDNEGVPDLTRLRGTASFKALIAKKKAEREAREAKEEEERRIRHEKTHDLMAEGSSDSEADRAMQGLPNMKKWHDKHGRTKRTSRKAMEEESRETQRMARNMQLAHEMRTKKKISKASLFARFNYKAEGMEEEEPPSSSPRKVDDLGNTQESDTPTTSPLTQQAAQASIEASAKPARDSAHNSAAEADDLSTMEQVLSSSPRKFTAAEKGKSIGIPPPSHIPSPANVKKTIRVIQPKVTRRASLSMDEDSDDDLEIVTRKPIRTKRDMDEIFRNIPAKKGAESGGLHALRLLAHLTSPSKNQTNTKRRNARPSMNPVELAMTLQHKARQQAAREREERLNELRAKGVHIETAEEKEARQNEVIDLVARAREENAAIRNEERRAQKLANIKAGIIDPMDDDSDSGDEGDEDWEEGGRKKHEASVSESDEEADDEIELSGSEDEEMGDEIDAAGVDLIDDAACETENDEDEEMGDVADLINDEEEDPEPTLPTAASRRRSRKSQIVDSDSDDDDNTPVVSVQNTPRPQSAQTPATNRFLGKSPVLPTSVLRSATKSFIPGMPVTGAVGLGLTQIFAGTMDSQADYVDSPMPSPTQESPSQTAQDSQQDSLAFLKNLPPPDFSNSVPRATGEVDVIPSSQVEIDTIPATQEDGNTQFVRLDFNTVDSASQAPDMTQDMGFSAMSPIKGRFSATPVPSVDTVVIAGTPLLPKATPSVITDSITDSPVKTKKGKLRRRTQVAALSDGEDTEVAREVDEFEVTPNAFEAMRRAASTAKKERQAVRERGEFDKKKSHAKDMVDEAATESEDEYAGLGGVSGSDSDSEDEQLNKDMLDETKISRKDKSGLQALAAQMDRDEDEAQVNKLYKDITTGGIRRKRGADYDLSDSDDDGEARRRMKRREFAKMRKAMMEDENIGKIVNKPKQAAFLKSLEDREDDEDMEDSAEDDIVDVDHATNSQLPADDSQDTQEVGVSAGDSQTMGPPKRKSAGENPSRMPPSRRTRHLSDAKRPKSLAEIRSELSQLLEDPNAIHFGDSPSSSSSDEEAETEDDALSVHGRFLSDDEDIEMGPQDTSIVLRETSIIKMTRREKGRSKENVDPFASRRSSVAVVDRSFSRQNSAASADGSRLEFAHSSTTSGFKVPPLLRKATGNSLSSATSSFSGEQGTAKLAATGLGAKMSNTASGKGFRGFAKEEQMQRLIQEGEKRRTEKRLKGVEERRRTVGGAFGRGKFE